MRILWITTGSNQEKMQSQFLNYAHYLASEFEIKLFYIKDFNLEGNNTVKELISKGVNVESAKINNKFNPLIIYKCLKVIRKFKPKVVHTFHPIAGVNGRIAVYLAKKVFGANITLISEQRNSKSGLSFLAKTFEIITFPIADLILCSSMGVEKSYFGDAEVFSENNISFSNRRHYTLHNTIDINKYQHLVSGLDKTLIKKELGIFENDIVISVVAAFKKQKGHIYLIDAIYQIKNKVNKRIKVLFVGDGNLRSYLNRKVSDLRLENIITFTGYRSDIYRLLYISDIFVLPSLWEGLPKALLEAMSLGVSPIATNVEGNEEVLEHKNNGLLVEPKSSEALASAITRLVNNDKNRIDISLNAKKSVYKFSVEESAKKIRFLYQYYNSNNRH